MSWDTCKFSSLYAIPSRNGLSIPSTKHGRGNKMINMGELFAYGRIPDVPMELVELSDSMKANYNVEKDDLLFARRSLVLEGAGKCSWVKEVSDITTFESSIIRVRLDKERAVPLFYYYYFKSPQSPIKTIVQQCAQSGIRASDLADLSVHSPPLSTQRRIADILSAYDDLIENNLRQIKLLEEAAMRLYREWFVFMRFPGHESVRIEDGVPEGWEKIRTSSVMKFNYGKGLLEANRSGDGYPVFGSSGIVGYHDAPLVNENCVIVGRKGNVGSVYMSLMPSYPIDTVFYIIPEIDIYYCYFELKSRTFVNNDSAVPGLNREIAEDMPMLLPSDKILEEFHNLIDSYIQRISYLEQQNVLLQKARDALLPRLMNGGVGLKLEEEAV